MAHRIFAALLLSSTAASLAGCPPPPPDPPPAVEPRHQVVAGVAHRGVADGVGAAARFDGPAGLAVSADCSVAYVADTFQGTLRRVQLSDGAVTTVVGVAGELVARDGVGTDARLLGPRGLGVSPDGAVVWIGDSGALRRYDVDTGAVTTVAGLAGSPGNVDGVGADARLGFLLHDVEVTDTTVYLADRLADAVRAVDLATGTVTTLGGVTLDGPGGMARDGDVLFVADTFAHVVRAYDIGADTWRVVAGTEGQAGANASRLDSPQGVELVGGALYTLGFDARLAHIDVDTGAITTVLQGDASRAPADGDAATANLGGAFAPPARAGDGLLFVDLDSSAVRRIDVDSGAVATVAGVATPYGLVDGPGETARLQTPYGVAARTDGGAFVADTFNHAVRVVDQDGSVTTLLGGAAGDADGDLDDARLNFPVGLALDEAGDRLFVVDSGNQKLRVIDLAAGTVSTLAGSGSDDGADGVGGAASFADPWEVVHADGENALYVADSSGCTVRRVDVRSAAVTTVFGVFGDCRHQDGAAGSARIVAPVGLALVDGALFVTDFASHTLRRLELASGAVTTVLGQVDFEGALIGGTDDALLSFPSGLAHHGGALFIAETGNHVVRRVDVATFGSSFVLGVAGLPGGVPAGAVQDPAAVTTLLDPQALSTSPGAEGAVLWTVGDHAVWRSGPLP